LREVRKTESRKDRKKGGCKFSVRYLFYRLLLIHNLHLSPSPNGGKGALFQPFRSFYVLLFLSFIFNFFIFFFCLIFVALHTVLPSMKALFRVILKNYMYNIESQSKYIYSFFVLEKQRKKK